MTARQPNEYPEYPEYPSLACLPVYCIKIAKPPPPPNQPVRLSHTSSRHSRPCAVPHTTASPFFCRLPANQTLVPPDSAKPVCDRPRPLMPNMSAGSEVNRRTPSSNVSTYRSRTQIERIERGLTLFPTTLIDLICKLASQTIVFLGRFSEHRHGD